MMYNIGLELTEYTDFYCPLAMNRSGALVFLPHFYKQNAMTTLGHNVSTCILKFENCRQKVINAQVKGKINRLHDKTCAVSSQKQKKINTKRTSSCQNMRTTNVQISQRIPQSD